VRGAMASDSWLGVDGAVPIEERTPRRAPWLRRLFYRGRCASCEFFDSHFVTGIARNGGFCYLDPNWRNTPFRRNWHTCGSYTRIRK
jgi:hypothetical protein